MEFRASHILVKDQSTAEKLYERVKKGEQFGWHIIKKTGARD